MGWTLGIVFVTLAAILGLRLRSRKAAAESPIDAPVSDSYVLQGRIEVTNTCEGPEDHFPRTIRVTAALVDDKQTRSEASVEAQLEPGLVAEDGEARFEGTYKLSVAWTGARSARYWEPPRVTRIDGKEICEDLTCEGPNRCVNIASRPRRITLSSVETDFTLRIACICVPD